MAEITKNAGVVKLQRLVKKYRVILTIALAIAVVGGFIAYDQFNTSGGTKASKYVVRQIIKNAKTIHEEAAIKETLGERIEVTREGKEAVSAIWYEPDGYNSADKLPVFVYIHGGAWISTDATDVDTYMQDIADRTPCKVVNINYKLLQEKPFPYQQEEAVDVIKWLIDNADELKIDPERIVISGGSAGGHITAGAEILLNREGIQIAAEILEVPFLDFADEPGNDLGIFSGLVNQLVETLSPDADPYDPVISPCRAAKEDLEGLCDTYFIVGLQDPLYKQAVRYNELLGSVGGIYTSFKEFDTNHGYMMDKVDDNGNTVTVQDVKNDRAAFKYKVRLLQHIFYGEEMPD